MTKQTHSSDSEGNTFAGALTVTVGSPSSSSIALRFSHQEFPQPLKLPAQASRSPPAAREDPSRAPPALPAGPHPPCRGLSSPPRSSFCHTLNVSSLLCRRQHVRENSGRAACQPSYLPAGSGAAADSPAPGREKAPRDGGSSGSAAARARAGASAGPGLGASERARGVSRLWQFSPLWVCKSQLLR